MIPVNRPLIEETDIEAVARTLSEGWISGEGPVVAQLEQTIQETLGVEHAVAVSSGTTACDLLMEAIQIGPGDELVAPATTIISTVSHAARRGARLQLVDADPLTWCMTSQGTVERFTSRTRVAFPVHIYGLPVDLDPIMKAADPLGIQVFEDAAEAIGLQYKDRPCGSIGQASIFSFYANKTVTGGEGGLVATRDPHLADRVRSLRNLCFSGDERFVHKGLGFNARMPSLVAALVDAQLTRLTMLVERKRQMGARYQAGLLGHPWLQLPLPQTDEALNAYWVFGVVLLPDAPLRARELQLLLRERGIDTRRFFCPLNLQPILRDMGAVSAEPMPVSEMLWDRGVYLPCGIGTTIEEIDQTVEALWAVAH